MTKDPVSPDLYEKVMERDNYECQAVLAAASIGENIDECSGSLELDHVKDEPRMGKRAPSTIHHLIALCHHHHQDGWATAHRPLLRERIKVMNAPTHSGTRW